MKKNSQGFTLLEILIALTLIAILVGIAVPSYQANTERSRRTEAQTELATIVQDAERFYTRGNTFTGYVIPAGRTTLFYDIIFEADGSGGFYTIRAKRKAASVHKNDKCGDYVITSSRMRTLENNTLPMKDCWAN